MNSKLTIFFIRVAAVVLSFVDTLTLRSFIIAVFWGLTFLLTTNLLPQFLIIGLMRWGIMATIFNLQILYSSPTRISPVVYERLLWINNCVLASSIMILANANIADTAIVFSTPFPAYGFHEYSPLDTVLDLVHGCRVGASRYYFAEVFRIAIHCWKLQYQEISSRFENAEFWRPWIMYHWVIALLVNKYTSIELRRKFD